MKLVGANGQSVDAIDPFRVRYFGPGQAGRRILYSDGDARDSATLCVDDPSGDVARRLLRAGRRDGERAQQREGAEDDPLHFDSASVDGVMRNNNFR